MEVSPNTFELLKKQKSSDGMRAEPYKTRHPASKDPGEALCSVDTHEQPDPALGGLGAHQPGLDHVDGRADGRCDEARQERGGEVRRQIVL